MPPEPQFDSEEEEEAERRENGAVVLVGVQTHREDVSSLVDGEREGVSCEHSDKVMRGCGSSSSLKSLGTQLSELDSMVTHMQDMAEEMTSEPIVTVPPPPPPSPPPPSLTKPKTVKRSPLPAKPPPPVLIPSVKKTVVTSRPQQSTPAAASKPPPQPPSHTPSHPPPPQPPSHPPSLPPSQPPVKVVGEEKPHPLSDGADITSHEPQQQSTGSIPQSTGLQSILQPGGVPVGGDMQLQLLQLLQQQVLQLQLQQQFSQPPEIHEPATGRHGSPSSPLPLPPPPSPQHGRHANDGNAVHEPSSCHANLWSSSIRWAGVHVGTATTRHLHPSPTSPASPARRLLPLPPLSPLLSPHNLHPH